jgi:hypothetical protein
MFKITIPIINNLILRYEANIPIHVTMGNKDSSFDIDITPVNEKLANIIRPVPKTYFLKYMNIVGITDPDNKGISSKLVLIIPCCVPDCNPGIKEETTLTNRPTHKTETAILLTFFMCSKSILSFIDSASYLTLVGILRGYKLSKLIITFQLSHTRIVMQHSFESIERFSTFQI